MAAQRADRPRNPPPTWPALRSEVGPPSALEVERGIWGKVHGASSDYRWIARSAGFNPPADLPRDLELGSEDHPCHFPFWRSLGGLYYAGNGYPSRARDTAGRSGFVEKHVLRWTPPAGAPAAAAALLLLPRTAALDDREWWERKEEGEWERRDYALALKDMPPLVWNVEEVVAAAERGRMALLEEVDEGALIDLYAALLAGRGGVPLRRGEPLSPPALAALLLPLPRPAADRLSLVGRLPSNRFDPADLAARWDVVVSDALSPQEAPSPSSEEHRRARTLVEALAAGDPARLAPAPGGPAGRRRERGEPVIRLALWGPPASGKTVFLAQLYLEGTDGDLPWEIFPTAESLVFGQQMRDKMRSDNLFPPATTGGPEGIVYRFRHRESGREACLELEDRPGAHSVDLEETHRRRLGEADGLVLVFDPLRDPATLESEIWTALERLHVASGRGAHKDERPIAVCLSKADVLIQSPLDYQQAVEEPDSFVRQRVPESLTRLLDRFCTHYRFFPVSSAGIQIRHGVVQRVVFFDEALNPRITSGGRPFNILEPFAWLLDEVGAA